MGIMIRMQVYIISLGILLVVALRLYKDKDKHTLPYRLFSYIIFFALLELLLDASCWIVNGKDMRYIITVINALQYLFNPVPLIFWILYLDYQIYADMKRFKKTLLPLAVLFLYFTFFTVLTLVNGQVFYIDQSNLYHRGPWFDYVQIPYYLTFAYSILLILFNRRRLYRKRAFVLLAFAIPPVIGTVLQMSFFGLSMVWPSVGLSIMIVYFHIQSQNINTDYMTGLYNRRELDSYLVNKIKGLRAHDVFGALMIDIDDFKSINDIHGHKTGDHAIAQTALMLRKCFHHDDFIARYGGDEFVIVVDLKQPGDMEKIVARLRERFDSLSPSQEQKYNLNISIGSAVYDNERRVSAGNFLSLIDRLMYEDKKAKSEYKAS